MQLTQLSDSPAPAQVAVKCLGVEDELAALGLGDPGCHGDLATEFVGRPGLALANLPSSPADPGCFRPPMAIQHRCQSQRLTQRRGKALNGAKCVRSWISVRTGPQAWLKSCSSNKDPPRDQLRWLLQNFEAATCRSSEPMTDLLTHH